ncbi:helix-turn-helix transcriptional regulator [Streptomyces sp. NPDC000618]|uniref:helix-turn-helix domain-containing protein n=1 Tax=Streptomyces sp. NPDC000618 TaxID=3154265 RepID=UPI00332516B9
MPDDDEWIAARRRAVGDRLRERRLHLNLTQEAVHLAAGVSRYTLQRAEAGEEVQISTLIRVAHVLGSRFDLVDLVR